MFAESQAVARRVAEQVSAERGETLWLRDYPVEVEGEVGRVVIGVARGELYRVVALVSDLGSLQSAVVEVATAQGPTLRGHQLGGARREGAVAAAIAAAICDWPEPRPLGLLDAAYGIFDALGQRLAVAGSPWRVDLWDGDRSGVSVELYGDHEWRGLISIRPAPGGVIVRIPAAQMCGAERTRTVATFDGLRDELDGLIDDARAAIDARAAFRARPDSIEAVGNLLIKAIRSAKALRGKIRLSIEDGGGFPHAWPTAMIEGHVKLVESADGITVSVDNPYGPYRGFTAMAADLAALLAEIRIAGDRLSPEHLIEGRIYQVIAPLPVMGQQIAPGTQLQFIGRESHPRDAVTTFRFTILDLSTDNDADIAILRRLHEFLAPLAPS